MSKKNNTHPFQPFWHDELEIKQKFLELARDFTKNPDNSESVAHQLAGGLLYANLAEYVASHLLESFKQIARQATTEFYFGVVYLQLPDSSEKPLGGVIAELKSFEFPLKVEIIKLLEDIKTARDKLSHKILKLPASQLDEIDESIRIISVNTEELVNKIDVVYAGMPPKSLKTNLQDNV